ncbi:5644_t:CDS:2 [Rhizophagus irregularis]|nr:5644_t:CDS:2 [Rhizophagus irregularis]
MDKSEQTNTPIENKFEIAIGFYPVHCMTFSQTVMATITPPAASTLPLAALVATT